VVRRGFPCCPPKGELAARGHPAKLSAQFSDLKLYNEVKKKKQMSSKKVNAEAFAGSSQIMNADAFTESSQIKNAEAFAESGKSENAEAFAGSSRKANAEAFAEKKNRKCGNIR
jgi:hypothetical protein